MRVHAHHHLRAFVADLDHIRESIGHAQRPRGWQRDTIAGLDVARGQEQQILHAAPRHREQHTLVAGWVGGDEQAVIDGELCLLETNSFDPDALYARRADVQRVSILASNVDEDASIAEAPS